MKKTIIALLTICMLISVIPAAAEGDEIQIAANGKFITFTDAKPYRTNDVLMLPLRAIADQFGWKVTYDKANHAAILTNTQSMVALPIGFSEVWVNNVEKQLPVPSVSKNNRLYVPAPFFTDILGYVVEIDSVNGILLLSDTPAIPDGIMQEEVIIGEGSDYPLGGTLTLPTNTEGKIPAVVLVHGSGPNDRDETIYSNKPFRDIAWGLAQQGIAVLRYDKRTFVHGSKLTNEDLITFTVKQETVDDAIEAAKLLKSDARIDSNEVYLIGHSLGGMLSLRIDAQGGDFAGIVSLGGSPRTLWEIIYDQNQMVINTMADSDPNKQPSIDLVEAEYAKAKNLATLSDEEAIKTTIFTLPAFYFKEMDAHSAKRYAATLNKPLLVLHADDDFQVTHRDFEAWKQLLGDHPMVSFKQYAGLNHLFIDYSGEGEGTIYEYMIPGNVSQQVILDIANWMNK